MALTVSQINAEIMNKGNLILYNKKDMLINSEGKNCEVAGDPRLKINPVFAA